MKTQCLPLLTVLLVGCHFDKLFTSGPSDRHSPPTGTVPIRLIFTTQPGDGTAGAPLATVRIAAADSAGRAVSSFAGDITVALAPNTSGGTLSGTATVSAIDGVATFSELRIERAATGYSLTATAGGGLEGTTSTSFTIIAGTAATLVFTTPPSDAAPGARIQPPVQVMAFDAFGNLATTFTGLVRVAIGQNGGLLFAGKLSGATSLPAVNGVATFSDLSIDSSGNGYTLTGAFETGSVVVESGSFNIRLL